MWLQKSMILSGCPRPPGWSRGAFYFILIGEWENVIVKKENKKDNHPARPPDFQDEANPHPTIKTRPPKDKKKNEKEKEWALT